MNVAAIRGRVLAANLAVYGLPVTVRAANVAAVITRGIWLPMLSTEAGPYPGDMQRAAPRAVLALPKSGEAATVLAAVGISAPAVSGVAGDRGTLIDAAPPTGGPAVAWRVDEVDSSYEDHLRVILRRVP